MIKFSYTPPRASSSSWEPDSAIPSSVRTRIFVHSGSLSDGGRSQMSYGSLPVSPMIPVRPSRSRYPVRKLPHQRSEPVDFQKTRAMESRCFCPPESLIPRCPISVSYPSGNAMINSWALAFLQQQSLLPLSHPAFHTVYFQNRSRKQVYILLHHSDMVTQAL